MNKTLGWLVLFHCASSFSMDLNVTLQFLRTSETIQAEKVVDAGLLKDHSKTCKALLKTIPDKIVPLQVSEVPVKTWDTIESLWKLMDQKKDNKVVTRLGKLSLHSMVQLSNSLEYLHETPGLKSLNKTTLLGIVISHITERIKSNPRDGFADVVQQLKPRLNQSIAHEIIPEFIKFESTKIRTFLRSSTKSSNKALTWSLDGTRVAFCNNNLFLVRNEVGLKRSWFFVHGFFMNCVSWSFDNKFAAAAFDDGDLLLYNPQNEEFFFERLNFPVKYSATSPFEQKIFLLGRRDCVLYDLTSRTIEWSRYKTSMSVWSDVAWSPCGKFIALSSGNKISIWDMARKKKIFRIIGNGDISAIQWSPDGKRIACVDKIFKEVPVQMIVIWNLESSECVVQKIDRSILSMNWSPEGLYITQRGPDGFSVYNVDSQNFVPLYKPCQNVIAMQWSSDGKHSVYNMNNKALKIAHKVTVPESLTIAQAVVLSKKVQDHKLEKFTNEAGERIDERAVFKNLNPEIKNQFSSDCIIS